MSETTKESSVNSPDEEFHSADEAEGEADASDDLNVKAFSRRQEASESEDSDTESTVDEESETKTNEQQTTNTEEVVNDDEPQRDELPESDAKPDTDTEPSTEEVIESTAEVGEMKQDHLDDQPSPSEETTSMPEADSKDDETGEIAKPIEEETADAPEEPTEEETAPEPGEAKEEPLQTEETKPVEEVEDKTPTDEQRPDAETSVGENEQTYEENEEEEDEAGPDVERESGDGEEEPDMDEDRGNPAFIPKRGPFYQHDLRITEDSEDGDSGDRPPKRGTRSDGKWQHDLYISDRQAPKRKDEIVYRYGYDIRGQKDVPMDAFEEDNRGRGRKPHTNANNFERGRGRGGRGSRGRGGGQMPEWMDDGNPTDDLQLQPFSEEEFPRLGAQPSSNRPRGGRGDFGNENRVDRGGRGFNQRGGFGNERRGGFGDRNNRGGGFDDQRSNRGGYGAERTNRGGFGSSRGGYSDRREREQGFGQQNDWGQNRGARGGGARRSYESQNSYEAPSNRPRRAESPPASYPTREFRNSNLAGRPGPRGRPQFQNNYQSYERRSPAGADSERPAARYQAGGRRRSSEGRTGEEPRRQNQTGLAQSSRGAKRYSTQRQGQQQQSAEPHSKEQTPETDRSSSGAPYNVPYYDANYQSNAPAPVYPPGYVVNAQSPGYSQERQYVVSPVYSQSPSDVAYAPPPAAPPPYHVSSSPVVPYPAGGEQTSQSSQLHQPLAPVFYDPTAQHVMVNRPPVRARPRKGIPIVAPPNNHTHQS